MSADDKFEKEYKEELDWLFGRLPMFSRIGAAGYKPGLERVERLDAELCHPHRRFKSIHIAGTNGKGSTSSMIASILMEQGYKTALYTSPHLVDFRERMRVDGKMIPKERVMRFIRDWKEREKGYQGDQPSFFELTMMMAFQWFAEENVDYAVIEVGMGGRLDSTNIITPELCVITNISLDHTQFLGHTLPEIALEKAGIMKTGVPVVIGEAEGAVREVFRSHAAEVGAPISEAYVSNELTDACLDNDGTNLLCESNLLGSFKFPLTGDYQKKNINTALEALKAMRGVGIEVSDDAARRGFANTPANSGLAARWMIMKKNPAVICDTGHNIAGLSYNFSRLESMIAARRKDNPEARLRIVIGFVADKAIDNILDLAPADAEYYITNAAIPRALPASELSGRFREHGIEGRVFTKVSEAVAAAGHDSRPEDIIYIGGSTFVVADYLESLG